MWRLCLFVAILLLAGAASAAEPPVVGIYGAGTRWAGNVRELDNVMQRAMILRTGNEIDADCIQITTDAYFENNAVNAQESVADESVLNNDWKGREQQLILEALRAGKGSRKYAADKLGISARTLRYKLARMRDSGITV